MITPIYYVCLDGSDVIVSAGVAPGRDNFEEFIVPNKPSAAELLEVDRDLTSFIGYTYDRETGETTPPEPPPVAAPFASPGVTPIIIESLIIALDEKDNGDPNKWQELLAQARNTTNGQSP
jgi:hypothetical protein